MLLVPSPLVYFNGVFEKQIWPPTPLLFGLLKMLLWVLLTLCVAL